MSFVHVLVTYNQCGYKNRCSFSEYCYLCKKKVIYIHWNFKTISIDNFKEFVKEGKPIDTLVISTARYGYNYWQLYEILFNKQPVKLNAKMVIIPSRKYFNYHIRNHSYSIKVKTGNTPFYVKKRILPAIFLERRIPYRLPKHLIEFIRNKYPNILKQSLHDEIKLDANYLVAELCNESDIKDLEYALSVSSFDIIKVKCDDVRYIDDHLIRLLIDSNTKVIQIIGHGFIDTVSSSLVELLEKDNLEIFITDGFFASYNFKKINHGYNLRSFTIRNNEFLPKEIYERNTYDRRFKHVKPIICDN